MHSTPFLFPCSKSSVLFSDCIGFQKPLILVYRIFPLTRSDKRNTSESCKNTLYNTQWQQRDWAWLIGSNTSQHAPQIKLQSCKSYIFIIGHWVCEWRNSSLLWVFLTPVHDTCLIDIILLSYFHNRISKVLIIHLKLYVTCTLGGKKLDICSKVPI